MQASTRHCGCRLRNSDEAAAVTDLRLGFYGDDFTGSTDALEALATAGWRTALFCAPPTDEQLARFGGLEVVGVAGRSRALAAAKMADELRPVFARFAA